MLRGRVLSSMLSTSSKFAALHERAGACAEFAQLLYCLLIPQSDNYGRFDGDLWALKCRVYPSSPHNARTFQEALEALVAVGLLERAEVGGRVVFRITQFDRHQHLRYRGQPDLPWPTDPPLVPVRASDENFALKRKEKKRKESTRPRTRAPFSRLPGGAGDYLRSCPHTPPCLVARTCWNLRDIAACVTSGRLTSAEGARLARLYTIAPQQVTGPPAPRARAKGGR